MSDGLVFNMVGGGSGGGVGYIEGLTLRHESFGFRVNDVRFNICSFTEDATVEFYYTSSNVSFTNCTFRYSTIRCTQSIRDAIESDSSNIIDGVSFDIVT